MAVALPVAAAGVALGTVRQSSAEDDIPDVLLERLYMGTTMEQYVAQLVSGLRQADRSGDGLDEADVAMVRAKAAAQTRASAISQVLSYDLNGDLQLTAGEVREAIAGDPASGDRETARLFDRYDTDGNNRITVQEAAVAATPRSPDNLDELLALDPNDDGRLTAAELRSRAERTFNWLDRDEDGTMTREEYGAVADGIRAAQIASRAPACTLPQASSGVRLVAYGGYEADSLSNAAVGGRDQETNLLDVVIEPGRQPLYLVLASYESMVWRLSGATERVQRVVVSSSRTDRRASGRPMPSAGGRRVTDVISMPTDATAGVSASGVVGLPADRVTIAGSSCPGYFYDATGAQATAARASLKRSVGREPDAVFGSYSAQRVTIPSGAITRAARETAPPPTGFDAGVWREAIRFWPGGLVKVEPGTVVAKVPIVPYQVLPSQMGLAQLVGSGAVIAEGGNTFRVVRPIAHMPPGMGGAHSVKLVFARGVPLPPGDPVHSCIVREGESGQTGARCGASGR